MINVRMLYARYKRFIMYAVFGVLTTLVNMVSYYLCFRVADIPNVASTVIAWVLAVLFAFITNKLWVFDSRSFSVKVLRHEIPAFYVARLVTGILDVGIMYLAVDQLHLNPTLWKLVSNVLVIVINYIASRFFIFRP